MQNDRLTATATDADLTLRLYDLRRETEMRKARNWFAGEFWPRTFEDLEHTMMQFGSPNSRWLGQVMSYWEMAAALVAHGTFSPALFFDTCHEAWFCYAKMKPFIEEGRRKFAPEFLLNLEKVIEGTPEGRERLRRMEQNIGQFRSMIEERKLQSTAAGEAA